MSASGVFTTCLTILLLLNGIMFFAGSASYLNIAGLSYVTFDLLDLMLTLVVIIGIFILATINVFGSGLDAGVLRYAFGLVVLIGIMFEVTFTIGTEDPISLGLGLLQNVLYPFFNPASTNLFSDLGLIIAGIFGMITLGSGVLLIAGGN